MNLQKSFYDFTSYFLRINRFVLFLLIAFPITIATPGIFSEVINKIIWGVSVFCLLCWFYAIAYKTNEGFALNIFKSVTGLIVVSAIISFCLLFFSTKATTHFLGGTLNYYKPWPLLFAYETSFLFISMLVAISLVSAEKKDAAAFREYFSTFLLFLFVPIGVWFIQPRIQRLL